MGNKVWIITADPGNDGRDMPVVAFLSKARAEAYLATDDGAHNLDLQEVELDAG